MVHQVQLVPSVALEPLVKMVFLEPLVSDYPVKMVCPVPLASLELPVKLV